MLAGGLDPLYRRMLAAGQQHYCRVEVWGAGVRLAVMRLLRQGDREGGLAYLPGSSITATLSSQVARNLTLSIPEDLFPEEDDDILAPMGNEIRVWRGILLPDRSPRYVWQAFRGRIQDATQDDETGECKIVCSDRAQDVLDAGFIRPENSVVGADRISEYQRLVRAALPDAEFGPSDSFAQTVPALSWEFDRGTALEEMFSSVGALWYPLADGSFVVRKYPWAQAGQPIITLSDGDGGVILRTGRSRSRRNMFNSVTATGERLNGDAPLFATAQDDDPTSPTFVGGKFGVKSLLMRRQTPTTDGGVQGAAESRLRTGITPTFLYGWSQAPDAALELGDVVTVNRQGRTRVQVVSSFTLPLDVQGVMTVQGRAQVLRSVEAGGS